MGFMKKKKFGPLRNGKDPECRMYAHLQDLSVSQQCQVLVDMPSQRKKGVQDYR